MIPGIVLAPVHDPRIPISPLFRSVRRFLDRTYPRALTLKVFAGFTLSLALTLFAFPLTLAVLALALAFPGFVRNILTSSWAGTILLAMTCTITRRTFRAIHVGFRGAGA